MKEKINICRLHSVSIYGTFAQCEVLDTVTNMWELETFDLNNHSVNELYEWLGY